MKRRKVSARTRKVRTTRTIHKTTATRRISKMKCERITRKKSSLLPPFKATSCVCMIKKGKDGMYESIEKRNGVIVWKKI